MATDALESRRDTVMNTREAATGTMTRAVAALAVASLLWCCGDQASLPGAPGDPGEPSNPGDPGEPSDPGPGPDLGPECTESFDSTFEAIQTVVFERRGCIEENCHGSARAGELDLRADVAYANLIDVPSAGSSLARIFPKQPLESYLYLKLAAASAPEQLFDQQIAGSPMPFSGAPLTTDQLQAVRAWIEAGAPEDIAVADNEGRGSTHIAELLGACLPEASPVEVAPLPPPSPEEGVQLVMPPQPLLAGSESEVCFASYFDFRGQIPARFLDETGEYYYVKREEKREDPNTHHIIVMKPTVSLDLINDPSFGGWECASGKRAGKPCDPLDPSACDDGLCRTAISESTVCFGFGPDQGRPNGGINFNETYLIPKIKTPGFFTKHPIRGLVYWNSHAFNLTPEDTLHHAWRNFYFTDDLRLGMTHFNDFHAIGIASGTPSFERATYCATHEFAQDDQVLYLASHTHKRGEFFWIDGPDGERIYESPYYDDPVFLSYDPPLRFDSPDPADRTVTYCATYNNGVNKDGSPNPETVTRRSQRPNGTICTPDACAEGRIGAPCEGIGDHATCDTSPGDGDGLCDACPITGSLTSDDEMFVMLGGVATEVEP
jgi:hypothetical protein